MSAKVTIRERKYKTGISLQLIYRDIHGKRHFDTVGKITKTPAELKQRHLVLRPGNFTGYSFLSLMRAAAAAVTHDIHTPSIGGESQILEYPPDGVLEAEIEAKRIELDLLSQTDMRKSGQMPVHTAVSLWLNEVNESARRPGTKKHMRRDVLRMAKWLESHTAVRKLGDLDTSVCVSYTSYLVKSGLGADTISHAVMMANQFLRWCIEAEHLHGKSPMESSRVKSLMPKKTPPERVWREDEWIKFMDVVNTWTGHYQADAIDFFPLIWNTGLRHSEAQNLRICDVCTGDPEGRNYVSVCEHSDGWKPKSDSSRRVIPLPEEAAENLDLRLRGMRDRQRHGPEAPLFPLFAVCYQGVSNYFTRARQRAGLDKLDLNGDSLTIHAIRRTFITGHSVAGTPVGVLRDLAGHSSIETTNRYVHPTEDHLFDAVRRASLG